MEKGVLDEPSKEPEGVVGHVKAVMVDEAGLETPGGKSGPDKHLVPCSRTAARAPRIPQRGRALARLGLQPKEYPLEVGGDLGRRRQRGATRPWGAAWRRG